MLTIIGLATVLSIVLLLIFRKIAPVVGLTVVPFLGALIAGFGTEQIGVFFTNGLESVVQVATMFIFAITFFGVLQDAGTFRPLVQAMVRWTRGNVVSVSVGTAIVGMLAHLDGAGATTFLLTIPALLPLYQRLGMSPYLMMLLLATGAGILNLLPWAGPVGRAAAVLEVDPVELWQPLIPVQIAAALLLVLFAIGLGYREKLRIGRHKNSDWNDYPHEETSAALASVRPSVTPSEQDGQMYVDENLLRPNLFWINVGLLVFVLATLVSGILPAAYVFMIGLSVALIINYRSVTQQMERIDAHAPNALLMGAIILSAGSFLGVLNGTGMLDAIANDLIVILPASLVPYLHLVIGVFGLPLELLLNTDAYYFALLPVVEQIVVEHGVAPSTTVYALVIGNVIGTFISPFSPALWLGLGLARLELGKYIRYSFLWMWAFSLVVMAFAALIGVITF